MQRPALTDKLLFLIKWLFEQSATENNHQLYYDWPSIHNSILKICSKFQVPSVHFSEVNDLLDEHWVKNVQSKNILCVALWSRIWLWNGSTYWSWRSLRRHDLSFTGYVSRQGVKDVSGPKRSRLLVLNCPVSGTVMPDRSAELHKWCISATMVQQWLS